MNKKIKIFFVSVKVLLLVMAVGAHAQEFNLLSAPFGTGSYVMGSALEQIVNKNHDSIKISHSESPGFAFNQLKLDKDQEARKVTLVGSGVAMNAAAAQGQVPFTKKTTEVMLIANYNIGGQWLATLDPNIKSVNDLAGKTVGLGRRSQINWTIQPEALIRQGHDMGDSVTIEYLGVKEALGALLDGHVDAAVVGAYFNPISKDMQLAPATQEFMASGRDIYFIDWGHDAVEKVVASGMPLSNVTIPENTIDGQTDLLEIYGDTVSWTAHKEFPENAAYEITKLIIDNIDSFGKAHAIGKLMTYDSMTFGWNKTDIHPGALRAYREAGLID